MEAIQEAIHLARRRTARAEHPTLAKNEASKNCQQFIRVTIAVMVLSSLFQPSQRLAADVIIVVSFSMNSVRPWLAFVQTDGGSGRTTSLHANVSDAKVPKRVHEIPIFVHSICSYIKERDSNGIFDHFLCRRNHSIDCCIGRFNIHSV